MHLGLDLLFLVPGETGGRETHARELLRALRAARPGLRITTFVNRETAATGPGFWSEAADRTVVLRRVWARREPTWAVGELAGVAVAAARAGVDLLHSPANFGCLAGPFARVLTIHDLGYRHTPELLSATTRAATAGMVAGAARRAHRVITVSSTVRAEVAAALGVPTGRLDVIPNGLAPPGHGDAAAGRRRAGTDGPIALSVATHLPHKNLPALLDAVAALAPGERPRLVLAGHGTDDPGLRERASALGVDVVALGAVAPAELEDLYAAADVLVTATRQEGFGLPVLEAMARGVPVAAADLPVLREVAGDDGAVWFDPADPAAAATAIRRALTDRERLAAAGRARAAAFSWSAAATATLSTYERALAAAGRGPSRPARASA